MHYFLIVCLVFCGMIFCVPPIPVQKTVPMVERTKHEGKVIQFQWKPNIFKDHFHTDPLNAYTAVSFSVSSFTDARETADVVGDSKDIISGNTETLVTRLHAHSWCSKNIPNALRFLGVSGDKKNTVILECELRLFTMHEEQSLQGEIELGVVAKGQNDMLIWEGSIKGSSDLYVRPAGSDGYSECFSNTLITTIYNLLNEPSFRDAIVKYSM